MKISNEELVMKYRMGLRAKMEKFILENGIETCSLFCDLQRDDSPRCEEIGISMGDVKDLFGNIGTFSHLVKKMNDESLRLQEEHSVISEVSGKCMMVGFSAIESQDEVIRSSGSDIGELPSEAFIKSTRSRLNEVISEGEDAIELLFFQNKKMINKVAYDVARGKNDLIEDLIGVANRQFLECARRTWSSQRGAMFSTYVIRCMFDVCKKYIYACRTVKPPSSHVGLVGKMASGEISAEATEIEDPNERVRVAEIRRSIAQCFNHHASIEKLDESLPHPDHVSDNVIDEVSMREIIKGIASSIRSPLARAVFENRVDGILDGEDYPVLNQIAERLYEEGYTKTVVKRQRVQQIMDNVRASVLRYLQVHGDEETISGFGLSEYVSKEMGRSV